MPNSLPQDFYKHLRQVRKPEKRRSEVPWMQILLLLAVVAGAGGYYYFFVWQYRLPQERIIKDRQGDVITARLEARDVDFLKYTLLSDLSVHYIAIDQLVPEDQDFVRKTSIGLDWKYPLEYQLVLDGKPVPVRIEARDESWVKYTQISDASVHYASISSLPLPNQDLIRHLPSNLNLGYPMDYTLTDSQGRKNNISLLGHNDDLVEYITQADNVKHYELISALSATDQALVRGLPSYLVLNFPVDRVLTTVQGKTLPSRIEGRGDDVVEVVNPADDSIHYYEINDLLASDQKFLMAFPENVSMGYPFTADLTDKDGKVLRVTISGRSASIVRFSLPGGTDDFYPLTSFSADAQKIVDLLPVNLRMQYPLDYALTGPDKQPLSRQVLGRSSTYVKINTNDGKIYAYPINKLSALNQSVLRLLPETIDSMEVAPSKLAGYYDIKADNSIAIQDMEKRIATTIRQDEDFQGRMSVSTVANPGAVDSRQEQLDTSRRDIESNYKKLLAMIPRDVLAAEPANVRKWRQGIDVAIEHIDYLQVQMSNPNNDNSERLSNQQDASQALGDMEALIKNVLNSEGLNIP
jgi:hypothetical protein